jgi:hypothetical protein
MRLGRYWTKWVQARAGAPVAVHKGSAHARALVGRIAPSMPSEQKMGESLRKAYPNRPVLCCSCAVLSDGERIFIRALGSRWPPHTPKYRAELSVGRAGSGPWWPPRRARASAAPSGWVRPDPNCGWRGHGAASGPKPQRRAPPARRRLSRCGARRSGRVSRPCGSGTPARPGPCGLRFRTALPRCWRREGRRGSCRPCRRP